MTTQLPVSLEDDEQVLSLSSTSSSLAQALATLNAGLQKAVGEMGADDVSFEVDASRDRLHLRLRAYRHRR